MNMANSRTPLWPDVSSPTTQTTWTGNGTATNTQWVSNNTSFNPLGFTSVSSAVAPNDVIIQGQMIKFNYQMSDEIYAQYVQNPDEIKRILVTHLVEEMWTKKCIEFTKLFDNITMTHKFHARIFVVPDTQVRILRQNGYDSVAR